MVMEFIEKLIKIDINQSEIGVVSPYKLQCKKIRRKCSEMKYSGITVGTAEVFQGQERKVMIMSTVRARQKFLGDFLGNAQVRLCVCFFEEKSFLIEIFSFHFSVLM